MNPGRFYLPRIGTGITPMMGGNYLPTRGGVGFLGKFFGSLKSYNWGNLLNGANKTLNVVNQTIPLVRQAGPMFNNMKNMLRLARAFGSETTNQNKSQKNHNVIVDSVETKDVSFTENNNKTVVLIKEVENNNYPNFFI